MLCKRHPDTTRDIGAPIDWDPAKSHCGHLAVIDADHPQGNVMMSFWEPTPAELERLNRGELVQLDVVGTGHPPVMLSVTGEKR